MDCMHCHKSLCPTDREHEASSPPRLLPGLNSLKLIGVRFPRIMQLQRLVLPARDGVANTLFLQPGERCMIVVGFAAPAALQELKWCRNALDRVGMLEDQHATLKDDGYIQRRRSLLSAERQTCMRQGSVV